MPDPFPAIISLPTKFLRGSSVQYQRAGLASGPRSDEVLTPSLRRSEGQRGQLGGRCSHRTASKTSMPTLNEQRNRLRTSKDKMHQGIKLFKKNFVPREEK